MNGEVDPRFIQKITSTTTKGKTSRSRSFQFSTTSGSPSNRRGRLQKAETISEDRLESARQAAGLDEKIMPSLETRVNMLKEDNTSQPSSDDEKTGGTGPPPPMPTIQVLHAWG